MAFSELLPLAPLALCSVLLLRMQEFQTLLLFSAPVTGWDFSCGKSNLYLFPYQMGQKSHHSMTE